MFASVRAHLVRFGLIASLFAPSIGLSVCLDTLGDIDFSGTASIPDTQCTILASLAFVAGEALPGCIGGNQGPSMTEAVRLDTIDHNCDSAINIVDIQQSISYVLSIPLSSDVDAAGDGCPNSCVPCVPIDGLVGVEVCDGADNDCDGLVDEDFPTVGQGCVAGNAPCTAEGVMVCDPAGFGVYCAAELPEPPSTTDTTCDGIDDDCDGVTDEDTSIEPSLCGQGACTGNTGFQLCQNGAFINTCDPFAGAKPSDPNCDGVDDDCDGDTDEDFVVVTTFCGEGVCANTGTRVCIEGELGDTCEPLGPIDASEGVCDGLDQDCDGLVDEEWVPGPVTCGQGACAAVGTMVCTPKGDEVVTCTPAPAIGSDDQTCDNIDDDCDGEVDEDCPLPSACNFGKDPECFIEPMDYPGKTCKAVNESYCAFFVDNVSNIEDFEEYSTQLLSNPLSGSNPSLQCYQYVTTNCSQCPFPTLEYCDNPITINTVPCIEAANAFCPLLLDYLCPDVSLTSCASSSFYNNNPFFPFYDPACTDTVQSQCDSLFSSQCPATPDLDTCQGFLEDPTTIGVAGCAGYVTDKCEAKLVLQCPDESVGLCADNEVGEGDYHPACEDLVTARCDNWREELCVPFFGVPLNEGTCTSQYPAMTAPSVPQPCRDWVDETCPVAIADAAEATFEAGTEDGPGCPTNTVEETGVYSYNVVDSVSDTSEFDCTPGENEIDVVHPHDVPFELTTAEAVFTAFSVLGLDQELGGISVSTCSDYVKQKYYDYYRFKAFVTLFESDPRRVWQAAYNENSALQDYALGTRVMNTVTGEPFGHFPNAWPYLDTTHVMGSITGTTGDHKNDYNLILFGVYQGLFDQLMDYESRAPVFEPIASIQAKQATLDEINTKLHATEEWWYKGFDYLDSSGWDWHYEMSAKLRDKGISDEELSTQYSRRQEYLNLLADWRTLEKRKIQLQNEIAIVGTYDSQIAAINAEQLVIVEEVEDLLLSANSRGCLTPFITPAGEKEPSVCDWAPQDLLPSIDGAFDFSTDSAQRRCEKFATPNLSDLAAGYTYLALENGLVVSKVATQDPRQTVSLFELYLDRMKDTDNYDTLFFAQIPVEDRPIYGQSWGDSDEIGKKKYFSINYSYGAGWMLDIPEIEINLCEMEASANAHLLTELYVLNVPIPIVDGGIQADTETSTFATHLNVLGTDYWDEGGVGSGPVIPSLSYQLNLVFDAGNGQKTESDSFSAPIFSFAGIDVVLRAGYSGTLGITSGGFLRVGANFDGDTCDTGLDIGLGFEARPFASLHGFIEAGLDLWIVELGVGGSLEIITVGVPVSVSLNSQTAANLSATTSDLAVDVDAELTISTLSGRLYFYVDTFWKTYKKTFFRWKGYETTIDLFSKTFDFNLGLTVQYCLSFSCFE